MFSKILIANRGEIAIRIIRACKEMGISTVAVYSRADEDALHVAMADEAVCIGEAPAAESYLRGDRIVSAALATGAQAIHPGYGFLSENESFVELCQAHGITFIGPSIETMRATGDKEKSKELMAAAGVPVIPGTGILPDAESALNAAERIGYPVLLKATAGGGGRGIRLVRDPSMMEQAFASASSEAQAAFGNGELFMEKYVKPAKHIEVQILADETGKVVCLGERECSIQNHNQKLVEETPSPGVDPALRKELMRAAVRAAKAAKYVNAGTIEFLLDEHRHFYYMEMNVRLQVEHAVTELLTNIDIVKWQIRIAAGVTLDFDQEQVQMRGHSIECRINATGAGKVNFLLVPGGPFVRFDTFLWNGYVVPPYYDALLGKLVVYASTREEAIRKMRVALCELVIEGVPNNIEQQIDIVDQEKFLKGNYNTSFFEELK